MFLPELPPKPAPHNDWMRSFATIEAGWSTEISGILDASDDEMRAMRGFVREKRDWRFFMVAQIIYGNSPGNPQEACY
jgi:hypothetical protein